MIVFVCGTYSDLSAERGAVLDAIQRLHLQIDSMEFFGARAEGPIETCLSEVRKSDVLVIIVGHRYGTLVPELGISYSEAEYDEAIRLDIPCLVYIRDENTPVLPKDVEPDALKAELLRKWKEKLGKRHTPYRFKQFHDLAIQVAVDLGLKIQEIEVAHVPKEAPESVISSTAELLPESGARVIVRFSHKFGDESRQLLHGLTTDSRGNIILVGDFWGSVDFGQSKLTSAGDRDIFLAKFDQNGEPIWSNRYGDKNEQVGVGVAVDSGGAVYIVGGFSGTLDFGGKRLVSNGKDYNVALAKLDSTGRHIWSRCFGDGGSHVPECIAVAPSGKVVIAGRFQGSVDFGGGRIQSKSNQTDIFLATFSSDGEYLWAKGIAGPFEQQARSIALDASGNIALAGVFKGTINLDDQALTEKHPTDYCGFLAKLDVSGGAIWLKRFGDPDVEQGSVVTFDQTNGDVLAAGFIRNKLPPQASGSREAVCFLARYDPTGVLRWSRGIGTNAFPDSLAVATDGRILLTGHFDKAVDFGLGRLESAGGNDIFAALFTSEGIAQWAERFGDQRQQFLVKGALGLDESIVLAGSFHGTIDFGSGTLIASGYDEKTEGSEDIFLAVLERR